MAMMCEMLSAIAHQWRQPLHALALIIQESSFSYELNPSKFNQESMDALVKNSMKQINFMSKTIDDFKNFFKPKKSRKLFSIKDSIESTISLIQPQFKKKDILILNNKLEDFKLFAYPNELSQVILNLLHNAKDAIRNRQKFEDIKKGKIEIEIFKNNNKGYIHITDNGGGIDEEIMDRVFEPYFTTKEEGKGTGIGLYMSKIIVEEHLNGKIYVKNVDVNDKRGVQFTIEFNI